MPGSTFRYGSHFCRVTRRPRLSSRQPIEAAATPLPREETTPPVTKIYFGAISTSHARQKRAQNFFLPVELAYDAFYGLALALSIRDKSPGCLAAPLQNVTTSFYEEGSRLSIAREAGDGSASDKPSYRGAAPLESSGIQYSGGSLDRNHHDAHRHRPLHAQRTRRRQLAARASQHRTRRCRNSPPTPWPASPISPTSKSSST